MTARSLSNRIGGLTRHALHGSDELARAGVMVSSLASSAKSIEMGCFRCTFGVTEPKP